MCMAMYPVLYCSDCCIVLLLVSDQTSSQLEVWSFLYLISSGEHDACVDCVRPKSVFWMRESKIRACTNNPWSLVNRNAGSDSYTY
jgi:hypothetical protein